MKTITTNPILALAAASLLPLSAAPARAQEDGCAMLGELAVGMMQMRQGGMPLSEMMGRLNGPNKLDEPMMALARAMVLEAYAFPQFAGSAAREQAAADFRNIVEFECYAAQ